ncbi:MAG TPA: FAD-dependent oxidoreductase [Bacteroidales bacterium]
MKQVLVIGGGIAGMEASAKLSELGLSVTIVEQTDKLGGKLNHWDRLFPHNLPAKDLLKKLHTSLDKNVQKYLNTEVVSIQKAKKQFYYSLRGGEELKADAILVSTGFEVFNARKKEEYGYGIYENVITSADLEQIFRTNGNLKTHAGKSPERIGIIHCVGSRDEKAGHSYCSQVCCITAVKQAIEIREKLPKAEVFCFYMDLRMFGRHFETIYKDAQIKHGVQFIRGRLSEAFENANGSIMLKVEDTLLGKPLKMNVDLVVLMVGMTPAANAARIKDMLELELADDGFFVPLEVPYGSTQTSIPGVFVAGTSTGPKTMENTINEARAAALDIKEYLE